jgi:hypothetical protein
MKTGFKELPTNWKHKKLEQLKGELGRGKPLRQFSAEDRDLLHMETSEKNAHYWKNEGQNAETDERIIKCQSIWRSMLVVLDARRVPPDNVRNTILNGIIAEADRLPRTH